MSYSLIVIHRKGFLTGEANGSLRPIVQTLVFAIPQYEQCGMEMNFTIDPCVQLIYSRNNPYGSIILPVFCWNFPDKLIVNTDDILSGMLISLEHFMEYFTIVKELVVERK